MTGIDFVYFDLDDTLLDHTHAEKEALQRLHIERPDVWGTVTFEEMHSAYRKINPTVWQKYSAGDFTKQQAKVGRFEQLLDVFESDTIHANWFADAYLDRYSHHWKAVDGALEAFASIASKVPVGIMTNGFSEIQRAKLNQFPIFEELSEAVIVSEEVGHLKPDVRLFRHAEEAVGVRNEAILYVGDSLTSDVDGGLGAGWKVAWYSGEDHPNENVLSFTNWEELTVGFD